MLSFKGGETSRNRTKQQTIGADCTPGESADCAKALVEAQAEARRESGVACFSGPACLDATVLSTGPASILWHLSPKRQTGYIGRGSVSSVLHCVVFLNLRQGTWMIANIALCSHAWLCPTTRTDQHVRRPGAHEGNPWKSCG